MGVIDKLVRLYEMDRVCDRLQKRLDQVPIKLKAHTDAIAALERQLEEVQLELRQAKASGDRHQLDVNAKEGDRDKVRGAMNAPKLTAQAYTVLQEQMAGLLADISSAETQAVKSLETVTEGEQKVEELESELRKSVAAYDARKVELEAPLADVRAELETRLEQRDAFAQEVPTGTRPIYERIRTKHRDAMASVDGAIDRAAATIGNDIHCSSCYMAVTSNDAVKVLGGNELVRCKACARILYVL